MPIRRLDRPNSTRQRVYQCEDCGTRQLCTTNHTNKCWPICQGVCRNIVQADEYNKRRETLTQTTHFYIGDYEGPAKPDHSVIRNNFFKR